MDSFNDFKNILIDKITLNRFNGNVNFIWAIPINWEIRLVDDDDKYE